jgi:hypothetical protein
MLYLKCRPHLVRLCRGRLDKFTQGWVNPEEHRHDEPNHATRKKQLRLQAFSPNSQKSQVSLKLHHLRIIAKS